MTIKHEEYQNLREDIDTAREIYKRRKDDNLTFSQILKNYTILVLMVTSIFTLGYNWRRVDELFTWKDDHAKVEENFVKRDVLAEQFKTLDERMLNLQIQIKQLTEVMSKERQK